MYNILKTRKIWYTISAVLVITSIVFWIIWGLNLGIDFTGGTLLQVKFNEQRPTAQEMQDKLSELEMGDIQVQPAGDQEAILKLKFINNEERQSILDKLAEFGVVEEESYEAIGPTIGQELRSKAIIAIILVIIGIIAFVSYAFRKVSSGPVPSYVYGLAAIAALVHDVMIVLGVFIALGYFLNVEINVMFITALLTILGYSVNDTIVVFDRIRENLKTSREDTFEGVINESVNQTLTRSFNTSLTTIFVLLALFLFGGETIKYFILALICGAVIGTYSSIFVASPLLLVFQKLLKR